MVLVCHVVSEDHRSKRSCDLKPHVKSPPAEFGGHSHCIVEI